MELRSELAFRVYRQVFFGVDVCLGYTLDEDDDGNTIPVEIPAGIRWYVRHYDDQIPDSYVPNLVEEVREKSLPGLSLAGCRRLTGEGFGALEGLGDLETLDLFNTQLDDEGAARIAKLEGLKSLNLAGTGISRKGLELLGALTKIEQLHLGWTDLGDDAIPVLAQFPSLKSLDIRNTPISDASAAALCSLPTLENLGLQETRLSDSFVAGLVPLAPRLRRLYLGYTAVTDNCVPDLKRFTRLRGLMLRATHVSRDKDPELRSVMAELGGVGTGPDCIQEGIIR